MTNFSTPREVCPYAIGSSVAKIINEVDIIKVHYEPIKEDVTSITDMMTVDAVSFNIYLGGNDKNDTDAAHLYKFMVDNGTVGIEHIPVAPYDLYCTDLVKLYHQKIEEMKNSPTT